MRGQLSIFEINTKTGQRQTLTTVRNTILTSCYAQMLQLLNGGTTGYISKMQFGTGSAATTVDMTTLQRPIAPTKNVLAAVSAATYTTTFSAYLEAAEANGFPLAEAGLLTAGGVLVARTTFAVKTKTSDYQYGFVWSITLKTA